MLELNPTFKSALGKGTRTSLFPVVRFLKGVRVEDGFDVLNEVLLEDSVNISTKEFSLSHEKTSEVIENIVFDPLLLNSPKITSSADIINNKYKISSVSLNVANSKHKGKRFSDAVQGLLNSVCQVYFCSNGINRIEDCFLVYTGLVRRFSQSSNQVKLSLEDLTQQMLSTKIPSTLIPDDAFYQEDDRGKPFPMVYGFVDKSPLVIKNSLDEFDEPESNVKKLLIDKPSQFIKGFWDAQQTIDFGNTAIGEGHPLISGGYLILQSYLHIYDNDGYLPIMKRRVNSWGDGMTWTGGQFYYFNRLGQASVNLNSFVTELVPEDNIIPTRVYRPIEKVGFWVENDSNWQTDDIPSTNKFFAFTKRSSFSSWKSWKGQAEAAYNHNWGEDNGITDTGNSATWWEPTICNATTNSAAWGWKDDNWQNNLGNGDFPVKYIQDGTMDTGLHVYSKNPDGEHKSGSGFAKLQLKQNVGDFPCWTKYVTQGLYHTLGDLNNWGDIHGAIPAAFWVGDSLVTSSDDITFITNANTMADEYSFPDFPSEAKALDANYDGTNEPGDNTHSSIQQASIEDGVIHTSSIFNTTNAYDNIKWGVREIDQQGGQQGDDHYSAVAELNNIYILQDVAIDKLSQRKYYADIAGRTLGQSGYSGDIESISIHAEFGEPHIDLYTLGAHGLEEGTYPDFSILIDGTENFNGLYEIIAVNPYNEIILERGSIPVETPPESQGEYLIPELTQETTPITSSYEIMKDILENELNYKGSIEESNLAEMNELASDWFNSFTLSEQEEAKKVFEDLFKSSLIIPTFGPNGQFRFVGLKQILGSDTISTEIKNEDVMKYSFELSKIDDVYNQVNVKYAYDYGSGDFGKETGYGLVDSQDNVYDTYDIITNLIYSEGHSKAYRLDYYHLEDSEAKLEVETKYVRDYDTARKLQKRLVSWYANQHLITKLDLPVTYMNLQVGDYINFSELLEDSLAFGQDYTKQINKNGQLVYPYFFVTKINISLDKVSIEAVQVHRGEYGFPEDLDEGDDGDIVDGAGNDDTANWDLPDPNDNPNYDDDTTGDNDEEEQEEEALFQLRWTGDNFTFPLEALVDTSIQEEWFYDLWITNVSENFTYRDDSNVQHTITEGTYEIGELSADILYEHEKHLMNEDDVGGQDNNYSGTINIQKKFVLDPESLRVDCALRVFVGEEDPIGGTFDQLETLDFYQTGEDIEPVFGDLNGDGIVNILDVVMLVNASLLLAEGEGPYIEEFDLNGDGGMNIQDIVILINIALGE